MTNASAVWDLRYNKDSCSVEELKGLLRVYAKKWCFQLERGDSGYEHYQGRISLIKKKRKGELMSVFQANGIEVPNYLEPTSTTCKGDQLYVMKEDTRIDGPWTDKDKQIYIPKQIREKNLRKWQLNVIENSRVFDDRIVNIIYDPVGNQGKSFLASYCSLYMDGIDLPPVNDSKELIQSLCDVCEAKGLRTPNPVFLDLPRSQDKSKLYGIYNAIEQIKKGRLYDMRYKYKEWWIDSPSVWCFTNILPDMDYLSADRWVIWTIKSQGLVRFKI